MNLSSIPITYLKMRSRAVLKVMAKVVASSRHIFRVGVSECSGPNFPAAIFIKFSESERES